MKNNQLSGSLIAYVVISFICTLCYTSKGFAQNIELQKEVLTNYTSTQSGALLIRRVGDVNADGFSDFGISNLSFSSPHEVKIFSGKDGSIIHNILLPFVFAHSSINDSFDYNQDGYDDIIISIQSFVYIVSGADKSFLKIYDFTHFTVGTHTNFADVDNDGWDDIIVSNPLGYNLRGFVEIYSGQTGNVIHSLSGGLQEGFGFRTLGLNDVDGDNHEDFVVVSEFYQASRGGFYEIFSGQTGLAITQKIPYTFPLFFGAKIGRAGDIDGDGADDFLLGLQTTLQSPGEIHLISGADGSTIRVFRGVARGAYGGQGFGGSFDLLADFNGDGSPDMIAGDQGKTIPGSSQYTASYQIISLNDGVILEDVENIPLYTAFDVSGSNDLNGDGKSDFVLLNLLATAPGELSLSFYGQDRMKFSSEIFYSQVGGTQTFTFDYGNKGANNILVNLGSLTGQGPITMQGYKIPLTPDPYFNVTSGSLVVILDSEGKGTLNLPIPARISPGAQIYHAPVLLDNQLQIIDVRSRAKTFTIQ